MKNQGHIADSLLDGFKSLERKTRPVFGVLAMDVADTGSQHGNAQIRNLLALCGVGALAHCYNAVFLAADSTYLSL